MVNRSTSQKLAYKFLICQKTSVDRLEIENSHNNSALKLIIQKPILLNLAFYQVLYLVEFLVKKIFMEVLLKKFCYHQSKTNVDQAIDATINNFFY